MGVSGWPAQAVELTAEGFAVAIPTDTEKTSMLLALRGDMLTGQWIMPPDAEPAAVTLHAEPRYAEPLEERVRIPGPAGLLGASIVVPNGAPLAAVVFIHGSGSELRDASRFSARALARAGIASAIYDERGVAESQGAWQGASFQDLAADAVAVAEFLSARVGLVPIGFRGQSQGGWIAPLAAAMWKRAAFVITVSGPAVPPAREAEWDAIYALRRAHATPEAEAESRHIVQLWHAGLRSNDWAAFETAMATTRKKPWFASSGLERYPAQPMPAYAVIMDYDPMPVLRVLDVPMLAMLCLEDESIDAQETADILRGLQSAGRPMQLKLYSGCEHSMRQRDPSGQKQRWPKYPSDFYPTQVEFISRARRRE